MDYERFIQLLRGMPTDPSAEQRVWLRISGTLHGKRTGVLSFADLWPKFLISAAALAAMLIIFFYSYAKHVETRNFVQHFDSTEYIYEQCTSGFSWN